ncbi:sigma factor-like helix-turn-helix DNA-binding protein [Amycolatopsis lurida]
MRRRAPAPTHRRRARPAPQQPNPMVLAPTSSQHRGHPRSAPGSRAHCRPAQPSRQMVAVYLHHVQGWTAKEIGEYLGCAESTAGVHIHRGVKRLRDDHHPARRRLRTFGKIGLAALVSSVVGDQLIRSQMAFRRRCARTTLVCLHR